MNFATFKQIRDSHQGLPRQWPRYKFPLWIGSNLSLGCQSVFSVTQAYGVKRRQVNLFIDFMFNHLSPCWLR